LRQLLLGDQLYQADLQHSSEQQKAVDEFAARYSSFCNNPAVVEAMSAAVEPEELAAALQQQLAVSEQRIGKLQQQLASSMDRLQQYCVINRQLGDEWQPALKALISRARQAAAGNTTGSCTSRKEAC
jgi:hypothetical protein